MWNRKTWIILFLLLSLGDLILSSWLFHQHHLWAREKNPIANWILTHLGLSGMAIFKILAVLLVLFILRAIAQSRPRLANFTLSVGCSVLVVVVGYSLYLLTYVNHFSNHLDYEATRTVNLTERERILKERQIVIDSTIDQVVAGELTLRQGAQRILASPVGQDAKWLQEVCFWYRQPQEISFACLLRNHIAQDLDGHYFRAEIMERIEQQLEQMKTETIAQHRLIQPQIVLSKGRDLLPFFDESPAKK